MLQLLVFRPKLLCLIKCSSGINCKPFAACSVCKVNKTRLIRVHDARQFGIPSFLEKQ